ncbi:hypothetical protein KR093_006660, partial [Drosophila rubida]
EMSFFGVYIPPSKAGFEGTTTQCAGSIAAENIKILPQITNGTNTELNEAVYEDPDYPPDSPLWLIFTEKCKALDVLRHYKEARLREFPNREQAESYVQFGFESIESLKRYGKAKPASKPVQLPTSAAGSYKTSYSGSDSPFSSSPTNCYGGHSASGSPNSILTLSSMFKSSTSGGGSIVTVGNGIIATMSNNSSNNSNSNSNSSSSNNSSTSSLNAERQPFRAPTKQELVEFRKQIEAGNYERVKRTVWDNPRYLISSGDTPTSLKEGYRYNAMHICAQGNQARIAELILKIISDRDFTQLYAGKKSSGEMCAALNENLLDYYLNMPDKGRGETPLHFAVKNGHIAVVEVLTAYPQCKSLKNTEGMYPKDVSSNAVGSFVVFCLLYARISMQIICQRAHSASPETYKKLELLLSEPHYVPVMRAIHNDLPPHIGQPFTPNDPPLLQYKTDESDRLNVDLTISALAGPMPREQAFNFFRRWKTPPRLGSNVISPLAGSPYISPMKTPNKSLFNRSSDQMSTGRRVLFSPTTPNKSLTSEPNGNHSKQPPTTAASQQQQHDELEQHIENNNNNDCAFKGSPSGKVAPKPKLLYNMSTPMRQMRQDLFLEYRGSNSSLRLDDSLIGGGSDFSLNVSNLNDSFRERHIKNSDIEKGLEVVGRQLARQEQLEWREYWDFLDTFIDIASINGLGRLESYFAAQVELAQKTDQIWSLSQMQHCLDFIADRVKPGGGSGSGSGSIATAGGVSSGAITQVMTPYTCVEKSLQVFAKRITKTLINNISNMVSINDTLLSELKRLKSLIVSFKDDSRFITVDFSKVHSRIAHLVASYIAHSMEDSASLHYQLMQMLRKLLQLNGDRREHLHCVCASMLQTLKQAPPTVQLPDVLKTEELCSAAWQLEQCCACLWDANLSRKTSRRKRTESLRAQVQELTTATNSQQPTATAATLTAAAVSLRSSANATAPAPNVGVVHPVAKTSNSTTAYRNCDTLSDDDDIDIDDDAFFYECGGDAGAGDSSEDEDVFFTPPESRSPRLSCDLEPRYELFIFGKEPTKRDLDVLNAIFHVKIEKEALPFVHAWRTAMESFSTAEMDLFPSPKSVQRTHKPSYFGTPTSSSSLGSVGNVSSVNSVNSSSNSIAVDSASIVHPKRLFSTPKLNLVVARLLEQKTVTPPPPPPSQSQSVPKQVVDIPSPIAPVPIPTLATVAAATVSQSFQTPLNKVRGLFSKFRETRQEDSPAFNSP